MSTLAQLLSIALILLTIMLLVGCNSVRVPTPTPSFTNLPSVTLTTVSIPTFTPFYTPSPEAIPRRLTPQAVSHSTYFPPPDLELEPPTCYELPEENWVCLGRVYNATSMALADITISIQIGTQVKTTLLEQKSLQPNEYAPYRVGFSGLNTNEPPFARLVYAQRQTSAPSPLIIEDEVGLYIESEQGYGRYEYVASVFNTSGQAIVHPRMVIMLLDDVGRLVGYRIIEISPSLAGKSRTRVETSLVPLVVAPHFRHSVTVVGGEF